MKAEDHERRRRIWELLVYEDPALTDVIKTITEEFETSKQTVEADLDSIDEWLPKLDLFRQVQGVALLAELRQNRQRLYEMAGEARDDDELVEERKIRAEINRSLNMERYLSDSSLNTTPVANKPEMLEDQLF
ncbi:hypothetical protein [Halalkalicoccus salilacus]|uniref:hypothetical protein n=1 Tax=Halalkalicoccus TaxID=332246 RepID=UPI002F9695AD